MHRAQTRDGREAYARGCGATQLFPRWLCTAALAQSWGGLARRSKVPLGCCELSSVAHISFLPAPPRPGAPSPRSPSLPRGARPGHGAALCTGVRTEPGAPHQEASRAAWPAPDCPWLHAAPLPGAGAYTWSVLWPGGDGAARLEVRTGVDAAGCCGWPERVCRTDGEAKPS